MREARELESGLVPISLSMVDDLVQSHDGPAYAIDMLQLDESMVGLESLLNSHASRMHSPWLILPHSLSCLNKRCPLNLQRRVCSS